MNIDLRHYTPLFIASEAIRSCWNSSKHSDTEFDVEVCSICETSEDFSWIPQPSGERDYESYECNECNGTFADPLILDYITGEKDHDIIEKVGNKNKHSSTLEHLNYNFYISGVSRALLQELARHRISSFSVKSSRYTLKELKNNCSVYNSNQAEGVTWRWDEIEKFCVLTDNDDVNNAIANSLSNLQEILQDGVSNDIAKYCLPEAYKTELMWSVNARSLQNFLKLRTHKDALKEIQNLANNIFDSLPEDHKYLFVDNLYKK